MKEVSAKDINGRVIRITASSLVGSKTTISFADTGELIENVEKAQIEILPRELIRATLLLVHLGEGHDTPDGGWHRDFSEEVVETDQVDLDIQALVDPLQG